MKGVKVQGRILVQRDRYSAISEKPDLSRIVISAIDSSGNRYRAVTDASGSYLLYLPPGNYTISMDEKFLGNALQLAKNNFNISLQETSNYNQNFYLLEKKRKVRMQQPVPDTK